MCSGLFTGYVWLAGITALLIVIAAPVALTTVAVYGRGDLRTFCIGALFPSGMALLSLASVVGPYMFVALIFNDEEDVDVRAYVLVGLTVYFVAIIACGLLAVWIRRMVEPLPSTPEDRAEDPSSDEPLGPLH